MAKKDAVAEKSSAKPKKPEKKNGALKRMGRFFKDLKSEYKKIVWPSKKQVINNTLVVLAVVIVIGAFVAGLDTVLSPIVHFVLQQA